MTADGLGRLQGWEQCAYILMLAHALERLFSKSHQKQHAHSHNSALASHLYRYRPGGRKALVEGHS